MLGLTSQFPAYNTRTFKVFLLYLNKAPYYFTNLIVLTSTLLVVIYYGAISSTRPSPFAS